MTNPVLSSLRGFSRTHRASLSDIAAMLSDTLDSFCALVGATADEQDTARKVLVRIVSLSPTEEITLWRVEEAGGHVVMWTSSEFDAMVAAEEDLKNPCTVTSEQIRVRK